MNREDANPEEIREKAGDIQKRSLSLFEAAYKKKVIWNLKSIDWLKPLFRWQRTRPTVVAKRRKKIENYIESENGSKNPLIYNFDVQPNHQLPIFEHHEI